MTNGAISRRYNLDYLRGLAAFGIMMYHYFSWVMGKFTSDAFMGRVGIYGVSIFYVLSGLTLFHVYYDKMKPSWADLLLFFKKRVVRIFPLLWIATIAAILLSQKMPDFYRLFLNLSGLFGFIKWDAYFSAGVWSIGNELVFYVFFPLFVFLTKSLKPLMLVVGLAVIGIYLYIAFVELDPGLTLGQQWLSYINPLNQLFLFMGGFFIGYFFRGIEIPNLTGTFLLLLGLGLFVFYPAAGDAISLVTGVNRVVFTLCCFLICTYFYKTTYVLPEFIHKPLIGLGEASYSVYLLHPIVYKLTGYGTLILSNHSIQTPGYLRIIVAVILTLALSYWVYKYIERYFIVRFSR